MRWWRACWTKPTFLLAWLALQPWCLLPQSAFADSGGYSRPSSSGYSAPAYSSLGANGGYSRPAASSNSYGFSPGGGDAAISRQNAGQALQSYRTANAPPPPTPTPSGFGNSWGRPGSYPPPPPVYNAGPQRFGAWDAISLWALLEAVNTPRSSNFFTQNQYDPGYLKWRAEMNQVAASDPQVAGKLAQLDRELGRKPQAGTAPAAAEGDFTLLVLVIGIALFAGLWFLRRRAQAGARPTPAPGLPVPAGIGGSTQTRFRVGMTLPLDQTPFILSAGMTKVTLPAEGNLVSVEAVGLIADGGSVALHRLYLPGRGGFFSLHLGALGDPDECRYFSRIDQVAPATPPDWGFWLDPTQGMIGWPEFQTKDGILYGRVWAGGAGRVPPREQIETIRDVAGERRRALHAMLYGRATGAQAPAPATEYILVEAIEQDNAAWVEIHAGIDINPAALTLPPVAFS